MYHVQVKNKVMYYSVLLLNPNCFIVIVCTKNNYIFYSIIKDTDLRGAYIKVYK